MVYVVCGTVTGKNIYGVRPGLMVYLGFHTNGYSFIHPVARSPYDINTAYYFKTYEEALVCKNNVDDGSIVGLNKCQVISLEVAQRIAKRDHETTKHENMIRIGALSSLMPSILELDGDEDTIYNAWCVIFNEINILHDQIRSLEISAVLEDEEIEVDEVDVWT